MMAGYFGLPADISSLRRKHEISAKGATLGSIKKCCTRLGLTTRALRCEFRELGKLKTPCILHWRLSHFVVLKSVGRRYLVLHDPARGVVREALPAASDSFTGVALEVAAPSELRRTAAPTRLKLSGLIARDADIGRQFLGGLVLALICEVLLLTTPYYLQIVIDQVLSNGDSSLLNTVAIAFFLLLLLQIIANVMRQLTFQYLGHVTIFDITTRVLQKLLRLPVRFFRSRDLGDIQHRIQSLTRIQGFVIHAFPALVLDAVFIVLITAVMMVYEPGLTLLMVVTLGLWCLWRALIFSRNLRLSNDIAQAESALQTHFLETLRAMQTIKVGNGEAARESEWSKLFAAATNSRIRTAVVAVVDTAIRQLLFQSARIMAIYLLAGSGLDGQVSVGMISAYIAYLGMFTTRGCGVVDRVLEYRLLEVPLSRLADVVFTDEELSRAAACTERIANIELRRVSFAYAVDESQVLTDCSLQLSKPGFVAIAGVSGSGKSTLLQLIAGNETAAAGQFLINERRVGQWSLRELRAQTATVFQGDTLFRGSVVDNIALFDPSADMLAVRKAADAACIADDIERLPMRYETKIGDLGSSLSRGQVQRILLARAFYRRPALLLLDEATSGLNRELENRVVAAIAKLDAMKVAMTHSDVMLQAADDVLWLHEGRLLLSRPDLNV